MESRSTRDHCSALALAPPIDPAALRGIERQLHLHFCKWDTQVGDVNVLAEHPLVLPLHVWNCLRITAEVLAAEIVRLESLALAEPRWLSAIGVPRGIRRILSRAPQPAGLNLTRAMRFDFHPTATGWCVSEVNADVPGGWREGATLPRLYQPFYPNLRCPESPLAAWGSVIEALARTGHVALLSAPGYLEDQQVLRTFGAELASRHVSATLIQSPAALRWTRAGNCTLAQSGQTVSAVIRFYQIEWLCSLPRRTGWAQLLASARVPVLNPTVSAIVESKRFPLLFRETRVSPQLQSLMPESRDPRELVFADCDHWVLKAAYSNTGDRVILLGDLTREEKRRAFVTAQRAPLRWVAQRRFATLPLLSCRGPLYPCLGIFVVGGHTAGAYVRLSQRQVTDGAAVEAPLLIDSSGGCD